MRANKTILNLAIAASLFSVSQVSSAAGFQLAEYSATGLGRAYAGEAAIADNAGAQWRNPAMLTYLEGTQVSVGAVYVDPNVDIEGTAGSTPAKSTDYAEDGLIPNLYVSHAVNDRLAAGFALATNYAMETTLGDSFAGNHHGSEARITTIEANLNLGYKLTDAVSIGGGVRYVMGEGHIGAEAPYQTGAMAGTALKYMEGDTTEWGWQAGAAWQITPEHRVGISYKSEVELKLEGYATGMGFYDKITPNPADNLAGGKRDNGYLPLVLPATAEIASFHQLTDKFAMHASINWTDWSRFEKLEATLDTYKTQMVKEENWKDNYRFALGATYQVSPKWTARTGIAYDTSAVDDEHRTITIPETDRTWLSIGAGYKWSEQLTIDGGLTYIFAKDASINESDASADAIAGAFSGETTGNVIIAGVQASYVF